MRSMNTYLISDTHFDSKTVMSMRPFACPADHDDHVLDQINSLVQPNDRLICGGDFCARGAAHLLARIRCRQVYLVIGNHDRAQSIRAFKSAEETMTIKIRDLKMFISHYPHCFWPGSHHGHLHAYGHVHDEREEWMDAALPGRRSQDVGLDTAKRLLGEYRPFLDTEVYDNLITRPGHDPIEYYARRRRDRGEVGPHEMGNFDG